MTSAEAPAIVGLGVAPLHPQSGRSAGQMALQAATAAIKDAGLQATDIDGIATMSRDRGLVVSFDEYGVDLCDPLYLGQSLGISTMRWSLDLASGADAFSAIQAAVHAFSAMACDNVLIVTTMKSRRRQFPQVPPFAGDRRFVAPYGLRRPVDFAALYAQRYMRERRFSSKLLGHVVLNNRRWASLTPGALQREPLTIEEYFDDRVVADPLRRLDCDTPVDGAYAFVLTRQASIPSMSSLGRSCLVERVRTGVGPGHGIESFWAELPSTAIHHTAHEFWEGLEIAPADAQLLQIYDGFSFLVPQWLEALEIVPTAGMEVFMAEHAASTDAFPRLNTFGGSLSHGRAHGANHIAEAIAQLAGRVSEPERATACDHVLVTFGGILSAAAMLLSRG